MKDWTGNSKAVYTPLGANNHSDSIRENNDYYATNPIAIDCLLEAGANLSHHVLKGI